MIKLVPFCEKQLRDIRADDNIDNLFRFCDISRAGYRFDKFTELAKEILKIELNPIHIITQVFGCTLDCPYCYVTSKGVWGKYRLFSGYEIGKKIKNITLNKPDIQVFHLMGGAPALYLNYWYDILNNLDDNIVFHSDFLLNECLYDLKVLKSIANHKIQSLFAVSLKQQNTPLSQLQIVNIKNLHKSKLKFYITYTGDEEKGVMIHNKIEEILEDKINYYNIKIKHYKSLE